MSADGNAQAGAGPERITGPKDFQKLSTEFNRTVRRARAALVWERLWPRAVPVIFIGGLFLSSTWMGLWHALPPQGRMAGVLAFAAAALAAPFLVRRGSMLVTKKDALRRLDENLGEASRPAQMLCDTLSENVNETTKEVWNLHVSRLWGQWGGKFNAGYPRPGVSLFSYGVMAACVLSAAAMGTIAGANRVPLLKEAFDWSLKSPSFAAPVEVKAWVTPPEKISASVLYLDEKGESGPRAAHKASILTIMAFGADTKVFVNGIEAQPQEGILPKPGAAKAKPTVRYEIKLIDSDTKVVLEKAGRAQREWVFQVTPDNAPEVQVESAGVDPKNKQVIEISCAAKDDFGIDQADVVISVPAAGGDPNAKPLPSAKIPPLPLPVPDPCSGS